MNSPRTRRGALLFDDSGYATIASTGIIIAAVTVLIAVAGVASMVIARHQAQIAADMAAISGAFAQVTGGDGCAEAIRIAESNNSHLDTCTAIESDIRVTVSIRGKAASAQAGPL